MAYGKLASAVLAAATPNTVYTVGANCLYAEVNINIVNSAGSDSALSIALTSAATPAAGDYIENGVVVPANGGTMENTGLILSPGEKIVVQSNISGPVVRISGKEVVAVRNT